MGGQETPLEIRALRFRQAGGFAGLVRGCDLSPDDLAAGVRRVLERLARLAGAGGGTPAPPAGRSGGARDLLAYEIEIETSAGTARLAFDEMNIPAGLDALVARLVKQSKPVPP